MTTPSVSKPRLRRLSAHSPQNATSASMPLQRVQCGSTGQTPSLSDVERFADAMTSAAPVAPGDQLIRERAKATLRDQRRVEISQRAGGGVARVREQQFAGCPHAPCSSSRTPSAGDTPRPCTSMRPGTVLSKPERNRADRANVARHVFARRAVAARGGTRERAVLVGQARCSGRRSSAPQRSRSSLEESRRSASPLRTRSSKALSSASS